MLYLMTRRTQSSILVLLNGALITWYCKQQNTVEALMFGLEFIALRVGYEINDGLRYKFRMMGVPVEGPTNVYCDNEGIVSNSSMAESTLKKKHLSACFHKTCECYTNGTVCIGYKHPENVSVLKS